MFAEFNNVAKEVYNNMYDHGRAAYTKGNRVNIPELGRGYCMAT